MKKQELLTGDIVVTRSGCLGVVIAEREVILFQNDGYDFLDMYTEDLLSIDEIRACDIMAVYRANSGAAIGFSDYNDEEPIYERMEEFDNQDKSQQKHYIWGVTQGIWGRFNTKCIDANDVENFIIANPQNKGKINTDKKDSSLVRIPGSNNLVIVYNKYLEEKYLKENDKLRKTLGVEISPLARVNGEYIYSRFVVFRMNEKGEFESVENEDNEILKKYLIFE